MSTFAVSRAHIAMLISAAADLRMTRLTRDDGSVVDLDLQQTKGRLRIEEILLRREQLQLIEVNETRLGTATRLPKLWTKDPQQIVQVLQWVRCYQYQYSSKHWWAGSDAELFCFVLTDLLCDRLARHFNVSWTVRE